MRTSETLSRLFRTNVALAGLLAVVLAIVVWMSFHRLFDHDEFEAVHSAWKITQGERIYVDFFQHHHPLLHYVLAPIIAGCGDSVFTLRVIRVLFFLLGGLILVVTYRLAVRISGRDTGVIALLILCSNISFLVFATRITPDVPQTLLGTVSLLLLFRHYAAKDATSAALSAVSLALAFLFSQKALFLCFLVTCLLLFSAFRKEIRWRILPFYALVFLFTICPFVLHVVYTGTYPDYVTFAWVLNMKFLHHFSPVGTLTGVFWKERLFWFFAGLGILSCLKTGDQKRLAFLAIGLLFSILLVRAPYWQYLLPSFPLFAVLAGHAVHWFFRHDRRALFAVVLLTVPLPVWVYGNFSRDHEQVARIEYVLGITDGSDYVYDGNADFNLFRKDLDFFWFSVGQDRALETYQTMQRYEYDIYERIDRYRPKVISTFVLKNLTDPRIRDHYLPSARYPDLLIRTD